MRRLVGLSWGEGGLMGGGEDWVSFGLLVGENCCYARFTQCFTAFV